MFEMILVIIMGISLALIIAFGLIIRDVKNAKYNVKDESEIGKEAEERYLEEDLEPKSKKVTEHDSLLFQREWLKKYREENLPIPNRKIAGKYSLGQILSLRYFEMEIIENFKARQKEKVLELK